MPPTSQSNDSDLPILNNGNGHSPVAANGQLNSTAYLYDGTLRPAVEIADEDDDEISLKQLLEVLLRRASVIGGVALASCLGIATLVMTRPPAYSGSFRMLVEPVTQGSRLAESLTSDTLQTLKPLAGGLGKADELDYISQIEVLKSEKLLAPVVQRIQQRYPELDYEALQKRFKISRPKDSKLLDIRYESADPEEIKFVLAELSKAFVDYSVTDRQTSLRRGIEFVVEQIQRQRQEVENLELKLEGFRRQNNLLDPKIASQAMSEQIAKVEGEQQANRVQLAATKTLYSKLRAQVGRSPDAALTVANLSEAPIYQELLGKLRELDQRIAVESARFTTKTPILQNLLDQRKELLPLLEAEAQRVFAGNVAASKLAQSSGFQGLVGRELTKELVTAANQVQVLQTQDNALGQVLTVLNQQTQNLAGVSRVYAEIERDLAIATASLGRLMTARENLQLEITRQINPWELISNLNDDTIKPTNLRVLLLVVGVLASLLIGVVAGLIADKLDHVYHTADELKELGLPCLGTIPYNSSLSQAESLIADGELVTKEQLGKFSNRAHRDQMMFLEAFYSLDANIRLLSSDQPIRSITVSSTTPSDGKSTSSVHLALAAVMMGRRVLIIDMDMRRPQVHAWLGVQNLRGLSTAITSDVDVHELIQVSPQHRNLHVLTAGPMPPAPGRLLSSNKMRTILQELRHEYDLIICDTPPIAAFADAKLVAPCTDGLLLVVGIGKTDRTQLSQLIYDLRSSLPAPILGLLANGTKRSKNHYDYYNRYYADRRNDQVKRKLPNSSG